MAFGPQCFEKCQDPPLALFFSNLFRLFVAPCRAPTLSRTQLVLAGDMDGSLDERGQHSTSVLVHRVRDWTEWSARRTGGSGGGSGDGGGPGGGGGGPSRTLPGVPPLAGGPQERFVDQRRYANISRCVCFVRVFFFGLPSDELFCVGALRGRLFDAMHVWRGAVCCAPSQVFVDLDEGLSLCGSLVRTACQVRK